MRNYYLPSGQFRHLLRILSSTVPLFYQTFRIPARIRNVSPSGASRLAVCGAFFHRFRTMGAFCDILLKTSICKVHTTILHILNIGNQTAVSCCIQSCNADAQDFGRLFSRNQFFHEWFPFLSRMWLWLSKSHECAGAAVITPQHRFTRAPQGSPPSHWRAVR